MSREPARSDGLWHDVSGPADAPLIVVIHGSMDRSAGMLKLSRRLDDEFRVLRYDRRGYGRSNPHPGPFGMVDQVDDLVALLGDHRALLIGHSLGGNVALATAQRLRAQVSGVAVYETPLSWEPWWPGTTAGAQALSADTDTADAAERFMRRMIGDARWEALPAGTRAARRSEGATMVGELSDLRSHAPWEASRILVPVVAGYGERGAPHHRQGMEYLVGNLPDGTLVELPECRHNAPLSHPDLFRSLIVDPLLERVGTW